MSRTPTVSDQQIHNALVSLADRLGRVPTQAQARAELGVPIGNERLSRMLRDLRSTVATDTYSFAASATGADSATQVVGLVAEVVARHLHTIEGPRMAVFQDLQQQVETALMTLGLECRVHDRAIAPYLERLRSMDAHKAIEGSWGGRPSTCRLAAPDKDASSRGRSTH